MIPSTTATLVTHMAETCSPAARQYDLMLCSLSLLSLLSLSQHVSNPKETQRTPGAAYVALGAERPQLPPSWTQLSRSQQGFASHSLLAESYSLLQLTGNKHKHWVRTGSVLSSDAELCKTRHLPPFIHSRHSCMTGSPSLQQDLAVLTHSTRNPMQQPQALEAQVRMNEHKGALLVN